MQYYPRGLRQREWGFVAALLLVGLGVYLRIAGLNWDSGALLHADERYLVMVLSALSWPDSPAQYFDAATSPLNPLNLTELNWYVYGTLPLFLAKLCTALLGLLGPVEPVIVGRLLAAMADCGTALAVFVIGRRVFSYRVGLGAAVLYALAVLPIQLAHFFTVDPFLNLFLALGLTQLLRLDASGKIAPAALLGLWWGCALASKLSAVTFAPLVLAALALSARHVGYAGALLRALLCLALAAVVFRLLQPYAFSGCLELDPRFVAALQQLARLDASDTWYPPSFQWLGRDTLGFALHNMAVWGMGVLLFAAAAGGVAVTAIHAWRNRRRGRQAGFGQTDPGQTGPLLLLLWLAVQLAMAGLSFNPTMRYLLPAYPVMAVLGAHFLLPGAPGTTERRRWSQYWPLALVVAASLLWALAFTAIYRAPATRIAASDWIYEHIPAGAVLGVEYWDDALPVIRPGNTPARYERRVLRLTDPATPAKRDALLRELARVDYLVVSSHRGYAALTRLPGDFPLATRYYELLFGNLSGFHLVAEFTSYPRLPGLVIVDDAAEEAFTVHDHPRVLIYAKSPEFSLRTLAAKLRAVSLPGNSDRLQWNSAAVVPAVQPVTDNELQSPQRAQLLHLAHWMLLLWAAGICGNALSRRLWPGADLPGRTLLIAGGAWLFASGLQAGLWSAQRGPPLFVAVLAGAVLLLLHRRGGHRCHSRVQRVREVVFWGFFAFFLLLRAHNPAIAWGERPMDFALLNAFGRTASLPPIDPWFAGLPLQYHAWGQYVMAFLGRLAHTPPALLYNLAAALTPALAAELLFWVIAAITAGERGRLWPALTGTALVLLAGNLSFWRELPGFTDTAFLDFWQASRVVPGTINEFPFWSSVFGDLHSHFLGMIFSALFLAGLVLWHRGYAPLPTCALLALALASIALTNTWALPVYVMLLLLFALASGATPKLLQATSVVLAALALAAPHWTAPAARASVQLVDTAIGLGDGLILFGPLLGILLLWALYRQPLTTAALALLSLLLITLLTGELRGLVAGLLVLLLMRLYPQPRSPQREFTGLLAVAGLLVILGSECFTVVDRMNTVFKYQFEAWLLLALASALALAEIASRRLLGAACGLLLLLGLPTSVHSLWAWWANPKIPAVKPTLDGLAFLADRDRGEALAVAWLHTLPGQPTLLEASGPAYGPYARLSAATGLPTPLGWPYHVWQHGHDHSSILQRQQWVPAAYTRLRPGETPGSVAINYAALCQLERETYGPDAGHHWRAWGWRAVYRTASCEIWRGANATPAP